MERGKIVDALRCMASVHAKDEELKCESCPYLIIEEIPEKLKVIAGFEENGKFFVRSCDLDRIGMDAANMLEADGKDR